MKKLIFELKYIIFLVVVFSSCTEVEDQLFDDKDAYIAFKETSGIIKEESTQALQIPLYISKSVAIGQAAFEIDTVGIKNPAIEGEDYTISQNDGLISFEGEFIKYITIHTIDNEVRDGTKQFRLRLLEEISSETVGMANEDGVVYTVTINDNEHPYASMFGSYNVYETTIEPKEYKYIVSVQGHSDADKLTLTGLWGIPQQLVLQLDEESGEVRIIKGQTYYQIDLGVSLDLTIYGWQWAEDDSGSIKRKDEVIGTFNVDKGEIEFPNGYMLQCTGPEGHSYIGAVWVWSIQDYCKLTKK